MAIAPPIGGLDLGEPRDDQPGLVGEAEATRAPQRAEGPRYRLARFGEAFTVALRLRAKAFFFNASATAERDAP